MNEVSTLVNGDRPLLTFDRFEPGVSLGAYELTIDETMLDLWSGLYGSRPGKGGKLPLAFAPMILMRALLTVVTPRPPGNLHVGQSCNIKDMPRAGEPFIASVSCSAKTLKKERRVVDFTVTLQSPDSDALLVSGVATIFWAQ